MFKGTKVMEIFFFGKLQNQLYYIYILSPHSALFLEKEWKTGFQDSNSLYDGQHPFYLASFNEGMLQPGLGKFLSYCSTATQSAGLQ